MEDIDVMIAMLNKAKIAFDLDVTDSSYPCIEIKGRSIGVHNVSILFRKGMLYSIEGYERDDNE